MESLESRRLLTTITILTYNSISDGGFEAPALAANEYQLDPPYSPWQYSGNAGVSRNGSTFSAGDPPAPAGTQVGFIQNTASITQEVSLDPGVYNLSLLAAQRIQNESQYQQIEVLIDNTPVGLIAPKGPVTYATYTYSPYETTNFTVATSPLTGNSHTVELLGMVPGSAALIDEVAISPVVDSLVDGGFEVPSLVANTFQYDPPGAAWKFSGSAGVSKNGSAFVTNWLDEAQNAPAGTQTAILQGIGSMSQTAYLDPGTYVISFLAAQRELNQPHYEEIQIQVDGTTYGTIEPLNTSFDTYESLPFTVAANPVTGSNTHVITLLGVDPLGGGDTALIDQVTLTENAISDGSFATPTLAVGQFQYAPSASAWQFSPTAGVARNYSGLVTGNPNAPVGTEVAFLQSNSSMSQSVNLVPGSYEISFLAAQRAYAKTRTEEIQVLVNGTQVALITPVGINYEFYVTASFMITTATNSIQFKGLNPQGGDNTALIDDVVLAPAGDQVNDGSFETPVLASQTYQYAPSGSSWQFSGSAGISTDGGAFASGNPLTPSGVQVAFIQSTGSFSQSVYLDADTYSLSFLAAQRAYSKTQTQEIAVWIDNTEVALVTPFYLSYNRYLTSTFTVSAGMHLIRFIGLDPQGGDNTALIDDVSLESTDNVITDANFQSPLLIPYTYANEPSGSGWNFTGSAGISANASTLTAGNVDSPDGTQVAYIQGNGSVSQTLDLDAGAYNISFLAVQRIRGQTASQNQQIEVLIDNTQVIATITPAIATALYTPYQTLNFTVPAGPHTITFLGMTPQGANNMAFIDDVTILAGCAFSDSSFESPLMAVGQYQYAPSGTGWQFSASAGISRNYSRFTSFNPNAPDGVQVAFLQDDSSMSQSVYLASGTYNISYLAAQRATNQSHYQSIEVEVDIGGVEVVEGVATPFGVRYGSYSTSNFTLPAGMYTVTFVGLDPLGGDNTAFVDDVQLNSTSTN